MAAGQVRLNRLDKFYGGMTNDPRDRTPGKFTFISGFDIYNNPNRLVPNTVFNRALYCMDVASIERDVSTATVTTATEHHLSVGQIVTIAGAVETEYNGDFIVSSVIDGTSFEYAITGTPTTPATGTITFTAGFKDQVAFGFTTPNQTLYAVTGFDSDEETGDIWYYDQDDECFYQYMEFARPNVIFGIADHRAYLDVTSITQSSTTATVTTTETHGLVTGDTVRIVGAEQLAFNGTFQITKTGDSTFTYTMLSAPGSDATGEIELSAQYLYATQYDTDFDTTYLVRIGTLPNMTNVYTSDRVSTAMVLAGHNSDNLGAIPHLYLDGILYVGHGNYIASVDNAGVFVPLAFTMPEGWSVVSMAEYAEGVAILARSPLIPDSVSKVFFWDAVDTVSPYARLTVAAVEPYAIRENGNALTAVCVDSTGLLRVFDIPDTSTIIEIHRFSDLYSGDNGDFPESVLDTAVVRDNDVLLFGNGYNVYAVGKPLGRDESALSISRTIYNTAPVAVSGITQTAGTATVTLGDADALYDLYTGGYVTISGADQDDYNGTFAITMTSPTTFTFTVDSAATTPATTSSVIYARRYYATTPFITAAAIVNSNLWVSTTGNSVGSIYNTSASDSSGIFFARPFGSDFLVHDAEITTTILDNSMPEMPKEWFSLLIDGNLGYTDEGSGILTITPFIETQSGATDYALDVSNKQAQNAGHATAAVHWEREIKLVGRELIIDMSLDSTLNEDSYLTSIAVLSRDMNII